MTKPEIVVIVAVIAVLGSMLVSAFRKQNQQRYRHVCINNLKQVGEAFWVWSSEHNGQFPMELSVRDGGTREFVSSGGVYPHFHVLSNLVGRLVAPKIFYCPADKRSKSTARTVGELTEKNISYFVGTDATKESPSTFLAGDRNLTNDVPLPPTGIMALTSNSAVGWTKRMHSLQGNIGLADRTVQSWSTSKLPEGLANTGVATNHLAMPLE